MAYTRTMNGKVPQVLQELHFDENPTPGSLNTVTSGGVDSAIDAAKDEMQDKIDEVTLDPSAVALGNVHLLDEVTSFAADAKILVDSETNGPGAMPADNLLKETAQNALAGNLATEFVPNSTTTIAGKLYAYKGKIYKAKEDYNGEWDATKFTSTSASDYFVEKNLVSTAIVSDNYDVNKVIKELYFSTPVSLSGVTIRVFNNRPSTSNDYLLGVVLTINGATYNLYKRSNTQFTDKVFFIASGGISAALDLSSVTGSDNTYNNVNLLPCVNHLEFNPIIKNYLQDEQISENTENAEFAKDALESISDIEPNDDNIYDNSNPNIKNLWVNGSGEFTSANTTRLLYVPCEALTTYTISLTHEIASRFTGFSSEAVPAAGNSCTTLFGISSTHTTENGRDYYVVTTPLGAKYLGVYYYNSSYGTATEAEIRASIMIAIGDSKTEFIPYSENVIIKESALPSDVRAAVSDDAFSTRSKSYGVVFNNSVASSKCTRIGDAIGKKFNYAVGSSMVWKHENDFDNIFPWCEIKRCNVSGGKVVAYEGDDNFELDGTNGDVFVEIPKFYSYRSIVGNIETIVISGTKKSGFEVEPAFVADDGMELDYIYIYAYATDADGKSRTGYVPQTFKNWTDFNTEASSKGYTTFDIAVLQAIQKLVLVENADKNVSQYYAGWGDIMYYGQMVAVETKVNTNSFQVGGIGSRMELVRVGQNFAVGDTQTYTTIRKVTAMTAPVYNSSLNMHVSTITLDGDPFDVTEGVTYAYGTMQNNGDADLTMTYHTGRGGANTLSACRYRWIENLWGNVWMQTAGICVKNLEYYFTYNTSKYAGALSEYSKIESFATPEQNHYPGTTYGWISESGYDKNAKGLALPKVVRNEAVDSDAPNYYHAKMYSIYRTGPDGESYAEGAEFGCVTGGGWDHSTRNSPWTMRFWPEKNAAYSHLYGNRYVIRTKI